jgi:hypothetical protein
MPRAQQIRRLLGKAAADMQALAAEGDDLDFPDPAVLPFIVNFLTDPLLRMSSPGRTPPSPY